VRRGFGAWVARMVSHCIVVAHDIASFLLKTGRYREIIAPDDLDTGLKTIMSPQRQNATSQFSVRLLHKPPHHARLPGGDFSHGGPRAALH
jgi:hypothetical protein